MTISYIKKADKTSSSDELETRKRVQAYLWCRGILCAIDQRLERRV